MFIKICGIIIVCLIGNYILKLINYEYTIIPVAITLIICISILLKDNITQAINSINQLSENSDINRYVKILFKALGISYLTFITTEICSTAGEELLSKIASTAGKLEILALCIPLSIELINITKDLL